MSLVAATEMTFRWIWTVTHNLNSTTPQVSIFDAYSNALVLAGVTANTANTIQIEFATNTGSYRVVCIG